MTEESIVEAEIADFHRWLSAVTAEAVERFGPEDRLGTANFVDTAARLRAATCIRSGEAVDLARPLVDGPGFHVETTFDPTGSFGLDRIEAECHGYAKTHMDALNHVSADGVFYGGRSLGDDLPSIADLAGRCLFTRAVFADIPAVRDAPWVAADRPVTGAEIDAATNGVDIEPGDALLLYMGRDRWEAEGNALRHEPDHDGSDGAYSPAQKPGAGRDAARWIAEKHISIVGWDFLDAVDLPDLPRDAKGSVHRLLPAIGLVLIDNCDLGRAASLLRSLGRQTAALAALPLAVPDGTGSILAPWLIL